MTKGELRKQRQAEHAAREAERLAAGDTRTAQERYADRQTAAVKAKRRTRRKGSRTPVWGSQEWAETRGDNMSSYDEPGDDRD